MDEVAIIETYFSCLKEKLLDINIPSQKYSNLTTEECDPFLYSWKDFM